MTKREARKAALSYASSAIFGQITRMGDDEEYYAEEFGGRHQLGKVKDELEEIANTLDDRLGRMLANERGRAFERGETTTA